MRGERGREGEGRGRVRRESGGRRERAEKEWHISVQSLYVFQQIHLYKNCQQHMDYTPTCTTTVITRLHTCNYHWFSSLQEMCVCLHSPTFLLITVVGVADEKERSLSGLCQSREFCL